MSKITKNKVHIVGIAAFVITLILAATPGIAHEEKISPRIEGALVVEFTDDKTIRSDDPGAKVNDLYNTTELGFGFFLNRQISVQTALTMEPVLDHVGNAAFKDVRLYAEELYFQLEPADCIRLYGGKFNPAFGTAWEFTPSLYGVDMPEDYEVAEMLGLGFELGTSSTPVGVVALSASVYRVDDTRLSDSLFSSRGRTAINDGGPANTKQLRSFAIALDGQKIAALPGLNWHVAYRHHEKAESGDDSADETGVAAGLSGTHPLGAASTLRWIGEYAQINDVEGQTGDTLNYYVAGAALEIGRYNVAASYTRRNFGGGGGPDVKDQLVSVSIGTDVYQNWALDLGYRYLKEKDVDHHTIGIKLAKTFEFSVY